MLDINVDDPDTIVRVYTRLRENPEFLVRYGDRVRSLAKSMRCSMRQISAWRYGDKPNAFRI